MPANLNDGTTLLGPGGDTITDEFVDPSSGVRRDPNLPPTGYKMPRSKIVVGPYGQDWGDATADQPLPAESAAQRRLAEIDSLRSRYGAIRALAQRSGEIITLADARGSFLDSRGQR